ncbi:MAG: hypothetical protein KZQ64_08040 [gamma proteobacterium symbiont of Bathyaustriella thionipta]|nr:hypothetical protein [gamma proteobacterium symbiont of Bathyaustriella thionipta]MCU7951114.1 hypothetical protein [gamma proteobacterium symbiont of Bathyaustriella thionipta]MCU7953323.1 hypothetical protein [gamma proteobacterium symbiont of Bathyaustriella thionipta]MCU7957629.1 hypothetical protein [gamma proteobacterium symbiont of Bathyaustriella thionipta]MCU7967330.1 hypothetical protein [gamma proteobacterium symbiont of Bathyaustriella thionipta]
MSLLLIVCSSNLFALQPFFDQDKATQYAPEEPQLSDFDLDVLMLCGNWGAEVKAVNFVRMMSAAENSNLLKRMRTALGDRIFYKAENDQQFIHQLRRVWFEQKGFHHVFCGEPDYYKLGGFH